MTDFGSGVSLDSSFDFVVGANGDLETEDGINELQKDLAFQIAITLDQYLGRPPTKNTRAQALDAAAKVVLADPRVDSVDKEQSDVEFLTNNEELELVLVIESNNEEQELVFNV